MKKISAFSLAFFLLLCLFGLGSCSGTFGKKLSGDTNEYSWVLKTGSKTLTITGKQPKDEPDLETGPWKLPEMQDVEHIVLNGKEYQYFVPDKELDKLTNLKTYSGSYNGATWEINLPKRTLTLKADGVIGNEMFPIVQGAWKRFADSIDRLVIGNGVTSIQQLAQVGTPADPRPTLRGLGLDTVVVGKKLKSILGLDRVAKEAYEVNPHNPTLFDYDGAVYTKDGNMIVARPYGKPSLAYHPDMAEQLAGQLGNFTWRLNFIDQSLTFEGEGAMPDPCLLVEQCLPYRDSVDRIVFGDKIETIVRAQDDRTIMQLEADTCILGKNMHHNMQLTRMATRAYEVDPDNPYLSVYDGVLYSKDFKKVVAFPIRKLSAEFHPHLRVIGQDSFRNAQIPLVVVPWDVTIVEKDAFADMESPVAAAVILPDTLMIVEGDADRVENPTAVFFYSDANAAAAQAFPESRYPVADIRPQVEEKIGFTSVYDYYPDVSRK